ncbi:hypothetical protein Hanom_Chr14g01313761 [Helianthus anomalus]
MINLPFLPLVRGCCSGFRWYGDGSVTQEHKNDRSREMYIQNSNVQTYFKSSR